jgi:predicted DNA-binding transcriptional regulator YafY
MAEPRGTGARFRQRKLPATDAAAFVRNGVGMGNVPMPIRSEVVVHAAAEQVRAKVGRWSTVEEIDADHCRMIMTSDSLDWPVMALGTLRADFDVVGPPELLDQLHEWAGRFSRQLRS